MTGSGRGGRRGVLIRPDTCVSVMFTQRRGGERAHRERAARSPAPRSVAHRAPPACALSVLVSPAPPAPPRPDCLPTVAHSWSPSSPNKGQLRRLPRRRCRPHRRGRSAPALRQNLVSRLGNARCTSDAAPSESRMIPSLLHLASQAESVLDGPDGPKGLHEPVPAMACSPAPLSIFHFWTSS